MKEMNGDAFGDYLKKYGKFTRFVPYEDSEFGYDDGKYCADDYKEYIVDDDEDGEDGDDGGKIDDGGDCQDNDDVDILGLYD